MKISIDEETCIGCGVCENLCPRCFKIENGISKVEIHNCDSCDVKEVAESCPVGAILVEQQD